MKSPLGDIGEQNIFPYLSYCFLVSPQTTNSQILCRPRFSWQTLEPPAHSTFISSVLFLQWRPCLSLMFPDGYMKEKFPKPKNFLGVCNSCSPPTPPTHPPIKLPNPNQTVKKKKSQVLKILSPSKRREYSLCPSLMGLSLKRSWWGAEEQSRWQVFM